MSAAVLAAIAANPGCARAAKRLGADIVYVSALNYKRGTSQMCGALERQPSGTGYPSNTVIQLPAILPADEHLEDIYTSAFNSEVLVESLGALWRARECGASIHAGASLNVTNTDSLNFVDSFGANIIWLSPELNIAQIRDMCQANIDAITGVKIAGAQELMICEHCVLMAEGSCAKTCQNCSRRMQKRQLVDRKGYRFPVTTDTCGRSHIYNSVALDVIHDIPELLEVGVQAFCVDTTLMDEEQTSQTMGRAKKAIELARRGESLPKQPHTTSGHFHRGVQ